MYINTKMTKKISGFHIHIFMTKLNIVEKIVY